MESQENFLYYDCCKKIINIYQLFLREHSQIKVRLNINLDYFNTFISIGNYFPRVEIFWLSEKESKLELEPGTFRIKLTMLWQLSYPAQIRQFSLGNFIDNEILSETINALTTELSWTKLIKEIHPENLIDYDICSDHR